MTTRFAPRVAELRGGFEIAAEPERAFRLFSPLGERDWVPGWNPELLHPPGAEWSEEQIFRTPEETGDAVWVVTRLDPAARRVVYHRVEPERWVARVEVRLRVLADARVAVEVAYTFVGLAERGNREIAAMTAAEYEEKMARWSRWIGARLATETASAG